MANTSATGGYLLANPATPGAVLVDYDIPLEDIFQATVVGITGISPQFVRPRFQPEMPDYPDYTQDWAALGVSVIKQDVFSYNRQVGDASLVERDEWFEVFLSFYGPNCTKLMQRWRDGLSIEQNRWPLQLQKINLEQIKDPTFLPSLLKERWLKRVDMKAIFSRRVRHEFSVLSLLSATAQIDNENFITPIVIDKFFDGKIIAFFGANPTITVVWVIEKTIGYGPFNILAKVGTAQAQIVASGVAVSGTSTTSIQHQSTSTVTFSIVDISSGAVVATTDVAPSIVVDPPLLSELLLFCSTEFGQEGQFEINVSMNPDDPLGLYFIEMSEGIALNLGTTVLAPSNAITNPPGPGQEFIQPGFGLASSQFPQLDGAEASLSGQQWYLVHIATGRRTLGTIVPSCTPVLDVCLTTPNWSGLYYDPFNAQPVNSSYPQTFDLRAAQYATSAISHNTGVWYFEISLDQTIYDLAGAFPFSGSDQTNAKQWLNGGVVSCSDLNANLLAPRALKAVTLSAAVGDPAPVWPASGTVHDYTVDAFVAPTQFTLRTGLPVPAAPARRLGIAINCDNGNWGMYLMDGSLYASGNQPAMAGVRMLAFIESGAYDGAIQWHHIQRLSLEGASFQIATALPNGALPWAT
jgi:hypothetical protein